MLGLLQTHLPAGTAALMGTGTWDQLHGELETSAPESWSHVGLALFMCSVKIRNVGAQSAWDLQAGAAAFLLSCLSLFLGQAQLSLMAFLALTHTF